MPYWKSVLIALDQLLNAIFGGWPDETISSRAFRWSRDGVRHWPRRVIDALFFLDRDKDKGRRHCELSYLSEQLRLQLPPEMRDRD